MTAASSTLVRLIDAIHAAGGSIERYGSGIRLTAPAPLPGDLITRPREAKPALLTYLHAPATEPILLADGRRLHRFRSTRSIPNEARHCLLPLIRLVRTYRVALISDGPDLIVIEPWRSDLPAEALRQLCDGAAEVIAVLRGEFRQRLAGTDIRGADHDD